MSDTFGSRLKQVRSKLGLSQEKFSKLIGISQFSLSFYETDRRRPDVNFLSKIKEIANIDLDWLICGNYFSQDISSISPEDIALKELIKWFKKHQIVQLRTLAVLEGIKIEYPTLFEEKEDNNIVVGGKNEKNKIGKKNHNQSK